MLQAPNCQDPIHNIGSSSDIRCQQLVTEYDQRMPIGGYQSSEGSYYCCRNEATNPGATKYKKVYANSYSVGLPPSMGKEMFFG